MLVASGSGRGPGLGFSWFARGRHTAQGDFIMRRISRPARLSLASAVLLASGLFGLLAIAGPASATTTLSVSPSTNLSDGSVVSVSGTGFADSSTGAILECNTDPNQPTISIAGMNAPVSCSPIFTALKTTTSGGALAATNFTVHTGKVGPPTAGTDSAGNDAGTDAALYPCPPTATQVTNGDTCTIAFGDEVGNQGTQTISFAGESTTTTTSGGGTTTTTSGGGTTTTTSTVTSTLSATAGGAVMATASGFNPGEAVNITIESTPVFLVQLFASSSGVVQSSIAIPAGTALGAHDLIFTGVDSGHVVTIPLTVVAFPGSTSPGSGGGGSGTGTVAVVAATGPTGTAGTSGTTKTVLADGTLAFTGAGPGVWFMAAGGLLLLNLGFLVLTMYYRPRELVSGAGRRISRIFGAE
jgi:hypothetical protein